MNELTDILRQILSSSGADGVLATLVSVTGSSYRRAGARLFVSAEGQRTGSISGGCLEEDVVARARTVGATGRPELVTYDTTAENDLVWGVGLGCHGIVQVMLEKVPAQPSWAVILAHALESRKTTRLATVWKHQDAGLLGTRLESDLPALLDGGAVFLQAIEPPPAFIIFGAGDDAQPLTRLARELGWHVTVADPRPAFATNARFPLANRMVTGPATELVDRAEVARGTIAVVMTHHYVHDVPVLRALFKAEPAYIGLLGPRSRAQRILADLARDGVIPSAELLARFHAPVGLDLGADGPHEVALSIVAEIQAALSGRDARSLRLRTRPIHE